MRILLISIAIFLTSGSTYSQSSELTLRTLDSTFRLTTSARKELKEILGFKIPKTNDVIQILMKNELDKFLTKEHIANKNSEEAMLRSKMELLQENKNRDSLDRKLLSDLDVLRRIKIINDDEFQKGMSSIKSGYPNNRFDLLGDLIGVRIRRTTWDTSTGSSNSDSLH